MKIEGAKLESKNRYSNEWDRLEKTEMPLVLLKKFVKIDYFEFERQGKKSKSFFS